MATRCDDEDRGAVSNGLDFHRGFDCRQCRPILSGRKPFHGRCCDGHELSSAVCDPSFESSRQEKCLAVTVHGLLEVEQDKSEPLDLMVSLNLEPDFSIADSKP